MTEIDLSVEICGIKMHNPTMLASGILGGTSGILKRMAKSGVGALITKSIGPKPRGGYPGPTVCEPMENVLLNAMGLPNPGYKEFIKEYEDLISEVNIPVIVSIFGEKPEEFAEIAGAFENAGAPMLELNISCPHPEARLGKRKLIGQDLDLTYKVVETVKKIVKIPIMVKLSPNVTYIEEFAIKSIEAGADAISAINTIQALEIEPWLERPVLGNLVGGMSGNAIRPIAQRKIADIILGVDNSIKSKKIKQVPIVGVGGISSGEDVAQFILLGCSAVQIGTAVKEDIYIFKKITEQLKLYMKEKGYYKIDDFKGNALKWLREHQAQREEKNVY